MRILRTLEALESVEDNVVVAIGVFDGVHLGHREVIRLCREKATAAGARPWVMTFDPHPLNVLRPEAAPELLTSLSEKLDLLAEQELAGCMVIPFTHKFADLEPEAFIERLLSVLPGLKGIVVGANWHFGKRARGDVSLLRELAGRHTLDIHIAEPETWRDEIVSSSRIRRAIKEGDLAAAQKMLGRLFSLSGDVIHGQKRGRHLGFPTANLNTNGFVLPPHGIYAATVRMEDREFVGALYLPRVSDQQQCAPEVHLLDFDGDLYGKTLRVTILERIRADDRRFDRDQALIKQIRDDIARIRDVVASRTRDEDQQ